MIIPSRARALPLAIAAAAACGGAIVAWHYHRAGLTLSHYDARGHLIVARRVFDSITPGWQQIGAVWLPLPHVLNVLPARVDFFYRTGASAVAISIAAFAIAAGTIAWIVLRLTRSVSAAAVGSAVFALNPNVLYLQSTPMTEPLLIALLVVAVALLIESCSGDFEPSAVALTTESTETIGNTKGGLSRWPRWLMSPPSRRRFDSVVGVAFACACLTRYEAWPATVAALAIAVWVRARGGIKLVDACRQVGRIALYPTIAIAAFAVHSRVVGGEWLTASGFFVPENKSIHRPALALAEVWWGAHALSGTFTLVIAAIGVVSLVVWAVSNRRRKDALLALALIAPGALPWAAFLRGHPFRIRYMVPLIAAEAVCVGAAIATVRRAAPIAAALVGLALAYEIRPLDTYAPMVLEAQWDRPNVRARRHVTDCVRANYDGDAIMASMGSLGHYMQEMASDGFNIRNFLHEGNGDIWLSALDSPRRYAAWIMVEEKAEGGDMLAKIARRNPAFLEGYERLCEGAGVVLYRRTAPPARP